MRLALIGFGGLGRIVADHLSRDSGVEVVAVAARARQANDVRAIFPQARIVDSAAALIGSRPELVVECASHGAFRQYAEPVLRAGIDLIAVSSGVVLSGIIPAGTVHGGFWSCVAATVRGKRSSSARSVVCASPVTSASFSSTSSGDSAMPSPVRSSRWFCQ